MASTTTPTDGKPKGGAAVRVVHHSHGRAEKRPATADGSTSDAKRARVAPAGFVKRELPSRKARRPLPPEWLGLESDTDDAASDFDYDEYRRKHIEAGNSDPEEEGSSDETTDEEGEEDDDSGSSTTEAD